MSTILFQAIDASNLYASSMLIRMPKRTQTLSVLAASWYDLPLRYFCIAAMNAGARPDLFREGGLGNDTHLPSELRLRCGNAAHREVIF